MALIQVQVIQGLFTIQQKQDIVERLTDAMVEIEGESMRRRTRCLIYEIPSGHSGVGGEIVTADDARALARVGPRSCARPPLLHLPNPGGHHETCPRHH